ncbi:MAG: hypothetical protein JRJ85_27355, partial [Deltaproteobacteria bacterium]|nr:hypothetical protein [Deltaproteobacteria bacterium]
MGFLEGSPDLDAAMRVQFIVILAFHWINSGNLAEARWLFESYRGLFKSRDIPPVIRILASDLEALFYWTSGDFEACAGTVTEGLNTASDGGVSLFSPLLRGHGTAGALSSGNLTAAEGLLKDIEPHLDRLGPWEKGFFHLLMTWKALLEKKRCPGPHPFETRRGLRGGGRRPCVRRGLLPGPRPCPPRIRETPPGGLAPERDTELLRKNRGMPGRVRMPPCRGRVRPGSGKRDCGHGRPDTGH